MSGARIAALLAAVTLLASSCSNDDPQPRLTTPDTTSPSSPSTSPSVEPTETTQPLGPEATVRAWVEARNLAMRTGDTIEVMQLSAPQCTSCDDLIDPITQTYKEGGRYETKGWRVLRSRIQAQSPQKVQITAGLTLAGGTTYATSEAAPVEYPSENRIAVFEVTPQRGGWVVSLIGFVR